MDVLYFLQRKLGIEGVVLRGSVAVDVLCAFYTQASPQSPVVVGSMQSMETRDVDVDIYGTSVERVNRECAAWCRRSDVPYTYDDLKFYRAPATPHTPLVDMRVMNSRHRRPTTHTVSVHIGSLDKSSLPLEVYNATRLLSDYRENERAGETDSEKVARLRSLLDAAPNMAVDDAEAAARAARRTRVRVPKSAISLFGSGGLDF